MASEIRVNKIINRSGLSTVTFTDDGAIVSGIVSASVYTGSGANLTELPGIVFVTFVQVFALRVYEKV